MSMNRPRIVVVGSVNADMVVKSERLPAPGETVTGGQFVMAAGGKGANQAVAAARLGGDVTLVAKTGQDMFGDQAVENYRREEIHTDLILRDPDESTGVALILVDASGENGGNDFFPDEDEFIVIVQPAAIGDEVWDDLDGDGVRGGGEAGLAGVILYLIDAAGQLRSSYPFGTPAEDIVADLDRLEAG